MRQLVSVGLAKTGRSMALGRKTGGRQKGSKNKPKLPLRQLAAEPKAEVFTEAIENEPTMLDIVMEFARDLANPPGFRLEAAKAALPYLHSKAPEAAPPPMIQITHIERVIVKASRRDDDRTEITFGDS
jgi:hypothetical protein